ncbi:MAG: NAD(P)-binding domain-containing protein [Bdellovibrionales bacterium]|nr:NAD(P)-binding domain-containing protein [Bdellovibrionales bacterium]
MFDIAIIGAGPIGIELAVEIKRLGLSYLHLEAGQIGSTISWYAPGTRFFSSPERIAIAGVPLLTNREEKATREEYLRYLRSVVDQYQLEIARYQRVVAIEQQGTAFNVTTQSSRHGVGGPEEANFVTDHQQTQNYQAKKVVLCIGDMHQPRLLGIPGEELPHVSHYLDDVHKYHGSKVLIVGGKNSAVEAAIRLYRLGTKVSLSYRGAELDGDRIKYWLYPELQHLIKKKSITFIPNSSPQEIKEKTVELGNQTVEADFVLLLTGYRQDSSLFESTGISLNGESKTPSYSRKTMETNVPGIYVAGTAVAGTQMGGVKEFIETSHVHVARIIAHLKGEASPTDVHEGETGFLEN